MRKFSRRTLTLVGAIALFSAAGVAWAAWTSSGAGSGSANSTTSVNSTISSVNGAQNLYPGAAITFTVSINNPNSYPVKVTGIGGGSSDTTGGGCAAGTVTSDAVASPPSTTIAAGGSGTYTLTAHMAIDAADNCKSQTFTIPLTATLATATS